MTKAKVYCIIDGQRVPWMQTDVTIDPEKVAEMQAEERKYRCIKYLWESKFKQLNMDICKDCNCVILWDCKSKSDHPCPEHENCERCKKESGEK